MKYQDYIVDATREAAKEAFRYIAAVPADKVDWKPAETSRSVLDIARELARTPVWAYDIIGGKEQEFNEEAMAKEQEVMNGFKTVQDCQAECERQLEKLFEQYRGISDARLEETKWLPFDGGRDFTVREMMDYPRWNFNYHCGQVAYIQTQYGDKEMH
ncbi:MAG TPA: hypothetical protein VGE01_09495 [Fimbriimonas sp.]